MKIAITVSQITPGGGLTKYVCTLADILTRNTDNEVYIITTHLSEKNPTIENLKKNRNIELVTLGNLNTIKKYLSLIHRLRKISPDIIINNYNASTQYVLPFISTHSKVIHILHNNTDDFYRIASINAKCVDRWVAPTPAIAAYFNDYTSQKYSSRVVVIPHGVDNPIFEPIKNTKIPQLIYVGVLYEHKGVKILPKIIKSLLSKNYKFHFTFIGEGILKHELEEELSNEINDGVVEFTGRISGEEVYKRLSTSDVFVYPTHIDSFGLVIAEAMINKVVPVVTHLKGITDSIIDDEGNGYLVEKDNVEMFVNRISYLLDNKPQMVSMQENAKRKALSKFSIDIMERNYTQFIKNLLC